METVLNHPLFMPILVTLVIIAAFPLVAGYIVLVERKVLADFQVRLGPMRVGPHGLLQPIADALKLLLKEDIIPESSDKAIFWFAPCISTITALTAFAVIPFGNGDLRRRRECRPAGHLHHVGRRHLVGYRPRWLVFQQQLPAARRPALHRAVGQLRSGPRLRPGQRCDGGGNPQHAGHRAVATDARRVGHLRQLRLHGCPLRPLHHRRHRRNQSRAFRSARSRIGTRRRLP